MSRLDHHVFDIVLQDLNDNLQENFAQSLNQLFYALRSHQERHNQPDKTISQISNYLRKKTDELYYYDSKENPVYSLRKLRNEIAHGRPRRDMDFAYYYPLIWSVIPKLEILYGTKDVENLISYTMHVENKGLALEGSSSSKIASTYKRIFDSMNNEEKQMVFSEMLLRLFSDPDAMHLLEEVAHK